VSKFIGRVTLVYEGEYDDADLQLVGCTLADLSPDDLYAAREEMVEATFQKPGECVSAETEIEATHD
jgi:hypothetical protein